MHSIFVHFVTDYEYSMENLLSQTFELLAGESVLASVDSESVVGNTFILQRVSKYPFSVIHDADYEYFIKNSSSQSV